MAFWSSDGIESLSKKSNFLISITLKPGVRMLYVKLRLFDQTELKVRIIKGTYDIKLQWYRDKKIKVWGKN